MSDTWNAAQMAGPTGDSARPPGRYWSPEHDSALEALSALWGESFFWRRKMFTKILSTLPEAPSHELVDHVQAWMSATMPFRGAVVPALAAAAIISQRRS